MPNLPTGRHGSCAACICLQFSLRLSDFVIDKNDGKVEPSAAILNKTQFFTALLDDVTRVFDNVRLLLKVWIE